MHKFVSPVTIWFGEGTVAKLREECERFRAKRVAVFSDPGVVKAGLTERVEEVLREANIAYTVYDRIVAEPPLAVADEAVAYVRSEGADLIIALGGGSTLDLAKAAAVVSQNEGNVADYLNLTGKKTFLQRGIPKILLPTTAGTGSEVTDIAVFSLETTKDVITHPYLLADVAIVDPAFTYGLPPRVTAASGVDALTHAVEAYVSVNATRLTDTLALEAMERISKYLRTAVWNGNDREARREMAWGSLMAGLAFYNAGVSGVHALAYPVGGLFHVPHGESNSVLLPYVFEYIFPSCMEKVANIAGAMGVRRTGDSVREAALSAIRGMHELIEDVGLPSSMAAYGIGEQDLDRLAADAMKQTRLLARSPKPYRLEDIRRIYERALAGRS